MKTIGRHDDLAGLVARLATLSSGAPARWGRMSAHQMLCHAGDALRMALGRKAVSPASGILQRTVIKWVALYAPLRWPPGIATRPEIDQACDGVRPETFDRDLATLHALLLETASHEGEWPPHPIFGRLSAREWLRWAYLHTDHHLRQFGV